MTDSEWQECLARMDENERHIRALAPDEPNPSAIRCVCSRHRTLAHLRACQESWLEACLAFDQRQSPRLKMLHPWLLFEQKSYALVPWEDHLVQFLADRVRWRGLLQTTDRHRKGKINNREHTIEGLTRRLVSHERIHLSASDCATRGHLRDRDSRCPPQS